MKQVGVAFAFALLAALAVGYVQRNRDFIFEYDWARVHGKLEPGASPALLTSARDVAEGQEAGKACAVEALAHDDRYLYAGLGCQVAGQGDHDFRAARFRYSGDHAFALERATPEAYVNSVHRLFPRAAYEKLWTGLARSNFLAAVQARAKAR